MRRPKILLLFALTVLATTFCTGKTESVSSATGTTGTPPATGATSATTTTNGTLPPVKIDMTIIGLATVADAAVTPNEAAKKTVILANQSGHTAMFIMKESNIDTSDTRFHYVGTIDKVKRYAFDLSGVQIELANDTWDEKGPVSFSNWGDSTNAAAPTDLTDLVQTSSLHWLPNMASVLGSGSYPPLPSYFNPEPSASNVLARIPLRGGTIGSLLLKPYWVWRFRNKNGYSGPKQVLAAEVHYTFNLKSAATTFQIYGRKFVTTGAPAPAAPLFEVHAAPSDTAIQMFLANVPVADFAVQSNVAKGYVDWHFHRHFMMFDGAPPEGYDAVIVDSVTPQPKPLTKYIYCGPVSVQ